MDAKVLDALKKCDTLHQMVQVLQGNFDTTKKLGTMQKGMILAGIDQLIEIAQLQPKK